MTRLDYIVCYTVTSHGHPPNAGDLADFADLRGSYQALALQMGDGVPQAAEDWLDCAERLAARAERATARLWLARLLAVRERLDDLGMAEEWRDMVAQAERELQTQDTRQ